MAGWISVKVQVAKMQNSICERGFRVTCRRLAREAPVSRDFAAKIIREIESGEIIDPSLSDALSTNRTWIEDVQRRGRRHASPASKPESYAHS
jgi:hypothetical protein